MYAGTVLSTVRSFRRVGTSFVQPVRYFSVFSDTTDNKKKNCTIGDTKIITAHDAVTKHDGLKKFLNKTYLYTGGGIVSTLGIGFVTSSLLFSPDGNLSLPTMIGGIVLGLGGAFGMGFTKYSINTEKYMDENNKTIEHYTSTNSIGRQLSYVSLVSGMGLMMGPVFMMAGSNDVLIPAMLASGLVFGGASAYAMRQPEGSLTIWGPALRGGLLSLLGCGLTSIVMYSLFGPNMFTTIGHSIDLYLGIPLFAGFVAYDTHVAIEMYKQKDPDHLGCSTSMYLDFMNILVRMIEIMSKFKKNN
jgi:FtsH-binding integral membrane protein